ncbi:MAG: hypothetical protein QX198_07495 [Methylococcaceae bacterium]
MPTIKKYKFMRIANRSALNRRCSLFIAAAIGLTLLGIPSAFADNAVQLKVLVVTTGDITQDPGLTYIKPVLDEMGVQYDMVNAAAQDLTAATLSVNGCAAATVGCVGNYNGVILTDSGMVGLLTPAEWDALHKYETDFQVREVVLSGWPGTYWDSNFPWGIYLDYGLSYTSSITSSSLPAVSNAKWTVPSPTVNPTMNSTTVFEYVNQANPLPITDFAYAAKPRNDAMGPRDGTVPSVTPLLQTPAGEALVSVIQYKFPSQTTPVREVMLSTISNASFLIHSQVLAYEFVNWVTQGIFVGGRFVHMANHLDDLFIPNDMWDINSNTTDPLQTYRLTKNDITNAVSKQTAFRAAHPTAGAFMLDFAFNGSGAVKDPLVTKLRANLTDGLVSAVIANKNKFRFINHTYTHADMDTPPVPVTALCDYSTFTSAAPIQAEITKNRTVWTLLGLPDQASNNRVLVSGNHSGVKDRKCTSDPELHSMMAEVQSDDVPFEAGANPLFFQAAANAGVSYLASDTSQLNQAVEQYAKIVNDGSTTDRLLLPRYPTSLFYNVTNPTQLVDEYNYMFHDRYTAIGQDPCSVAGAICTTRDYPAILAAETDTTLRHMLTFNKYPHFFHQSNVAKYNTAGNTLQFDWLNSVYTGYEKLFNLPVKNYPYYTIGDKTSDSLIAKSAKITAIWDRTAMRNTVTLSADKAVNNLLVTGLSGGEFYGGQYISAINVTTTAQTFAVDQAVAK